MARRRSPGGVTGFGVELLGDKELTRTFRRLEKKMQGKYLRPALRKGMRTVHQEARAMAPRRVRKRGRGAKNVRTGPLYRGIKMRAAKMKRKGVGIVVRTPTRAELKLPRHWKGYYPAWLEYKFRPFLRPALNNNSPVVLRIVRVELWKRIREGAKR